MQFKEEFISKIIDRSKRQTRRLVKEGEHLTKGDIPAVVKVPNAFNRIKWQVGKDYAVQTKRGTKGLWWCPSCITQVKAPSLCITPSDDDGLPLHDVCMNMIRPIRIKITDILKQHLLDVNEADARAEGFEGEYPQEAFMAAFVKILSPKIKRFSYPSFASKGLYRGTGMLKAIEGLEINGKNIGNPEVWALTFEVLK